MSVNMEAISALAEYLTLGKRVVQNSVMLEMTSAKAVQAEAAAFFELRKSFGIEGYCIKEQAEDAIGRTLGTIR